MCSDRRCLSGGLRPAVASVIAAPKSARCLRLASVPLPPPHTPAAMRSAMIYLACVALLIQGTLGEFLTEIVGPSTVNAGDPVTMKCKVLGEHPRVQFQWYRYGADTKHEVIGVGTLMTNEYLQTRDGAAVSIDSNFEDLDEDGNDVAYTMTIAAAREEDNALYGCGTSERVASTAQLFVMRAPDFIHLYGGDSPLTVADTATMDPYEPNQLLHIHDDERGYFMCVADNFIPTPDVTLSFAGKPLKNQVGDAAIPHLVQSETHPSFAYNVFKKVVRTSTVLQMETDANRLELACEATVPGTNVVIRTAVRPVLRLSPDFTCVDEKVPNGAPQQKLACILEADPNPTQLYWEWTTIGGEKQRLEAEATFSHKYRSTKEMLVDGRIKVSMVFERVVPEMFRTYHLFALNEIGSDWGNVTLLRDRENEPTTKKPSGGASSIAYSVGGLLCCITIAIWRLTC